MANPNDIIIPGADWAVPVDPDDPTKGIMTPVWKNEQLTGAILELREVVGQIGMTQQATGPAIFSALNEIGELIECLAILVLEGNRGPDAEPLLYTDPDVVQEAIDKMAEFVTARRELREQMEGEVEHLTDTDAPTVPEPVNPEAEGDGA